MVGGWDVAAVARKAKRALDATICHMGSVASRDLRNHTADVLRRVADGAVIEVTVHGRIVAEIGPPRDRRPAFFTREELVPFLQRHQADPGLREVLADLDQTTDDLGPAR